MTVIALILAAGRGTRAGGSVPKQYRLLGGVPVLRRTMEAFVRHPGVAGVRAVIHPDDRDLYDRAVAALDALPPVSGAQMRQESCRLGLESLVSAAPDIVLIHDAARPFVDAATIDSVLAALVDAPAALPALPVTDSIKLADEAGRVRSDVDRTGLWRAQTPQGFRFPDILAAHRRASGVEATDDAAVARAAGLTVRLVQGREDNVKLTTPEDFERATRRLYAIPPVPDFRVGNGFDVHPFAPGDAVALCGVAIPFDRCLAGHSDADVALHAVTDALLGAIGAGDIGGHFPPSDPQWRGADSAVFIAHAAKLVAVAGGTIQHVDLTIICEAPKISPHRDAMRARLAELLSLPVARTSVKATTTEGLGFLGRREGIAAQATATVCFR